MMPRLLAALVPALMLGGCAFTTLDHGLGGLMGQEVDRAVARLGAPNVERRLGEVRELEWNTFANQPVALLGYGNNGFRIAQPTYLAPIDTGSLLSMRTPGGPSTTMDRIGTQPQYCKVIVQVDSRGVIRDYRYDGNFEGCYAYGQLLGKKA